MLTLIVFFLILSLLVLIHEFGHFFSAKRFGVKVEEFGLGLPPRLFGKQKGETLYSVNALPFGGFVKLLGEEAPEPSEGGAEVTPIELDPRSFSAKSPLKRSIILVAGVTMNLLLGVFLYYVFFMFTNFKSLTLPVLMEYNFRFGVEERMNTVISGFADASKADESGIQVGEAILEVNGQPVYTVEELRAAVAPIPDQKVKLLVMNVIDLDRPIRTVETQTISNERGEGILGTYLTEAVTLNYQYIKPVAGFAHAYNVLAYSGATFAHLIQTAVTERDVAPVSSSVSGPVGIFSVVGSIISYGGKEAYLGLIDLIALLSLSLAFLNILPFPALDGGRLVFVIYEGITKRKISPRIENSLHKWGMLVLLSLIVLVTIKDISSIFGF